mmetsp:Transcript_92456/g.220004  ORF Transcript_92456/g.220004 Transcript_92456/m.220004 type:complete len:105 (+) Transcript_92456:43-357(+)
MGRSAKIVRTSAFEKQKRHEKGQEWKKSQWKQARENEKQAKDVKEKADDMDTEEHQKELSGKVSEAMKFFSLSDLAGGAASGAMEEPPKSVKTPKAKAKGRKKP